MSTATMTDNIKQADRIAAALLIGGKEAEKAAKEGVADVQRHVSDFLRDHAFEKAYNLYPPRGYTQNEWGRVNLDGFLNAAAMAACILFPEDEG